MNSVWKYPLDMEINELEMPIGAQVLTVREQHGMGCLWALVNPDREKEIRTFRVVGTGWTCEDGLDYQGSFHLSGGSLVFHVFENKQAE
jgi:hypothetical protein